MQVHVIETGRLRGNRTFMRAQTWPAGILRGRADVEFPVLSFVVEHPEGAFAVDAGLGSGVVIPRWQSRFVPVVAEAGPAIGAQMRAQGIDPDSIERVILTHLDWDHVGGIRDLPGAETLVHRPEYEAAVGRGGAMRYRSDRWPAEFTPSLYDLDGPQLGPFPRSRTLTSAGDVHLVPLPGHSAGQVGVVLETDKDTVLLAADHMLRWEWFTDDLAADRLVSLGIFFSDQARETSRRIERFAEETGAVVIPSHDETAAARLANAR